MKEKKVVREERNKEKLTSGDWVMAEFYSIHSLKSSRMHAVIDEFKKLMGGIIQSKTLSKVAFCTFLIISYLC